MLRIKYISFARSLLLVFFFQFIVSNNALAQDAYADSLRTVVGGNLPDTVKVQALIDLSVHYSFTVSDLNEGLRYANEAKVLASAIKFPSGLGYACKWSGVVYFYKSSYLEALDEWQRALEIFDTIGDKLGEANILSNIGAIYFNQGENDKALENYSRSLKLSEELGDKLRIATAFLNIGAVYFEKEVTHDLALENYLKAYGIAQEIEDQRAIGTACVNIGEIYLTRGDDKQSLSYYQKGYDAFRGLDGEPSALLGIASVYEFREEMTRATDYQKRAYDLALENEDLLVAAHALIQMAGSQTKMGNVSSSIFRYKKAIPLAGQIPEAKKELRDIYQGLSQSFAQLRAYDSAYKYQSLFINIKDTLSKSDKRLDILRRDFELERQEDEINQLTKENELKEQLSERQKIILRLVIAGFISVMIFLYIALKQKRRIEKEKKRSEELLLNILPYEVAEELKDTGSSAARHYNEVTVLFTDFKGFTNLSSVLTAQELVQEINIYFKAFDNIITKYKIEKIKTIGDAYMAAGGVPIQSDDSILNVIMAAFEMQKFVVERQKEHTRTDIEPFSMRVGIHTGSVVAGIVGVKKFQYDIWGDTVNTASRMESNGEVGKVNISQTTYEKLKDLPQFEFTKREKVEVKGKGEMQMYFVTLRQ